MSAFQKDTFQNNAFDVTSKANIGLGQFGITTYGMGIGSSDTTPITAALGQAQAYIKRANNGFGQAQADIKQVQNGYGQAQAYILPHLGPGQAQADIKQTYNAFGQANSDIKQVQNTFGQSQAYIRPRTGTGHAQAWITKPILQAQAQALVTSTESNYRQVIASDSPYGIWPLNDASGTTATAFWGPNGTYSGTITTYRDPITIPVADSIMGGIKVSGAGLMNTNTTQATQNFSFEGWVKPTVSISIVGEATGGVTGTGGQNYLWFPQQSGSNRGLGVAVGTNGIQVFAHGDNNLYCLASYSGTLPAGMNHVVVVVVNKQPKIYLNGSLVRTGLQAVETTVFAPLFMLGTASYSPLQGTAAYGALYNYSLTDAQVLNHYLAALPKAVGQAQAKIINFPYGPGQAQAFIFGPQYGQAQADILQTYTISAQANADIKQQYQSYAQAQARITAIPQHWQAQADILHTYGSFAQAAAAIQHSGSGQAQATIVSTVNSFAQAAAAIKHSGSAQAQASIKAIGRGYAQAQAHIFHVSLAQAQADIKATQSQSAQAAALIFSPIQVASAQAAGQIGWFKFGQANAQIVATDLYTNTIRADHPDAHWPLDDLNGPVARAIIGPDGTYSGAITYNVYSPEPADNIYRGVSTVQANFAKMVTNTPDVVNTFSYEVWFKTSKTIVMPAKDRFGLAGNPFNPSEHNCIWAPDQKGVNRGVGLSVGINGMVLIAHGDGTLAPLSVWSGTINPNAWHHAVVIFNDKFPRMYLDGQLMDIGLNPQGFAYRPTYMFDWEGFYWPYEGLARHAALYNYVLTIDQISAHYNAGLPKAYAQAQAYILQPNPAMSAQANARIKGTSNVFAQAQAYIIHTGSAQAQAYIIGHPTQSAQAQARMLHSQQYGQALGTIDGRFSGVVAQAQAFINTYIIEDVFANMHTYDLTNKSGTIYQDMRNFTAEATDPDPVYNGVNPVDGSWNNEYELNAGESASDGWLKFTITSKQVVHFDTIEFRSTAHDTVIGIYTGTSAPGGWTVLGGNDDGSAVGFESDLTVNLDPGTYILQVGFYSNATIKWVHLHYHFDVIPTTFAQAQALISPGRGIQYAQAQAVISQPTPRMYAQAQARVRLSIDNAANFYQKTVVQDGAVAYWSLDDLQSHGDFDNKIQEYALDNIGLYDLYREWFILAGRGPFGGQTGIPAGGTSIKFGDVDGSNYLYRFGQIIPFSLWTGFTIEFWFYPISFTTNAPILLVGNTATSGVGSIQFNYFPAGNTMELVVRSNTVTLSAAQQFSGFPLNQWAHVVLTRGTGNLLLYVNGVLKLDSSLFASRLGTPSSTVFLSPNAGSDTGLWKMDEMAFYFTQFTQAQAISHFQIGMGLRTQSAQAAAAIDTPGLKSGNAQAFITKSAGYGQAQAYVIGVIKKTGQARARIKTLPVQTAQAQARIRRSESYAQAAAFISSPLRSAQARAVIKLSPGGFAQSQARIITTYTASGQAIATIGISMKVAQAQAMIHIGKHGQAQASIKRSIITHGQAQAQIKKVVRSVAQAQAVITHAQSKSGQAAALVIARTRKFAQANALIAAKGGPKFGQAQARILGTVPIGGGGGGTGGGTGGGAGGITTGGGGGSSSVTVTGGPPTYLVEYNGYVLPGYAQTESFTSDVDVKTHMPYQEDGSNSEIMGLRNKMISLTMKVIEQDYFTSKMEAQYAATILRTNKSGYAPLYVEKLDRYYLVKPKRMSIDQTARDRMLTYSVEFDALPWITSNQSYTLTGTGTITTDAVGRTQASGGWTPTIIKVSGTNVTISGYTDSGEFTGFASISGVVNNFEINSQEYYATDNTAMNNLDFKIYVGPGKTNFAVTGATSCEISYNNRWDL
jgi:hypothetical protein